MRVKTGSVRSMDSDTNRVTSVQGSGQVLAAIVVVYCRDADAAPPVEWLEC